MTHLRLSRDAFRYITPLTGRRCIHTPVFTGRLTQSSPLWRVSPSLPKRHIGPVRRYLSQTAVARQDTVAPAVTPAVAAKTAESEANTPAYEMTFTCKKCETRSTHKVSKQGYHHGTVLITCPGCKNRHLISDHLKIFSDTRVTLEDIMKEKGQLVKKGSVSADGDIEFWDQPTELAGEEQGAKS